METQKKMTSNQLQETIKKTPNQLRRHIRTNNT